MVPSVFAFEKNPTATALVHFELLLYVWPFVFSQYVFIWVARLNGTVSLDTDLVKMAV